MDEVTATQVAELASKYPQLTFLPDGLGIVGPGWPQTKINARPRLSLVG